MRAKIVLIFLLLGGSTASMWAIKVSGYVVNNVCDTILGTVKLSTFNDINGALIFNDFNKEQLHFQVFFKENGNRRFKRYTPEDILAFGFKYEEKIYTYQSFEIAMNSLLNSADTRFRFLRLLYSSPIMLYLDLVRMDNYSGTPLNGVQAYSYQTHVDYYLYNKKVGLMRAIPSHDFNRLIRLLKHYDVHPEFIEVLPGKYRTKDIPEILRKYKQWLEEREQSIILGKSSKKNTRDISFLF